MPDHTTKKKRRNPFHEIRASPPACRRAVPLLRLAGATPRRASGTRRVITIYPEGKIVGCEVAHSAHNKRPFSSVGTIQLTDFKNAGGELQGKLSTGGVSEFFKKTWEVDLTFHTKAP